MIAKRLAVHALAASTLAISIVSSVSAQAEEKGTPHKFIRNINDSVSLERLDGILPGLNLPDLVRPGKKAAGRWFSKNRSFWSDLACMHVIYETVGFSRDMNPGNTTFKGGSAGNDYVDIIESGEVYCGLDGDDLVDQNFGVFMGGEGFDLVNSNNGIFFGGGGRDGVEASMEGALFRGGPGDDAVETNFGTYYGEAGDDSVFHENLDSGIFYGGEGNDSVGYNRAYFYGGEGSDLVFYHLQGFLDGGPGDDRIDIAFGASCTSVEYIEVGSPEDLACMASRPE